MSDLANLIDEYICLSRKYSNASLTGDSTVVNSLYDQREEILQKIEALDSRGEAILSLLHHEEVPVKFSAASDALKYDAKRALAVLEEISKGDSFGGI